MVGPAGVPIGGFGRRILFLIVACFMLNGCGARARLLLARPTADPGRCQVSDCSSASGSWEITKTRKRGEVEERISRRFIQNLCESHARMIMDGYRLTEDPQEVDEIHWFRFIVGNTILGALLGFGVAVGMIRVIENLLGHDSSLARAGNRAIILYIFAGWGFAFCVGWSLRL